MLSLRVGASWNGGVPTGGTWLHGLVPFGGLSFATAFQRPTDNTGGGGLLTVSWDMSLPPNLPIPTQVRRNSLVELFAGPCSLGAAVVSETPQGTSVTADGLFRLAEDFKAVDASFQATTNIATAVTQAIGRGLRWVDPGDLPSTSVSSLSEGSAQVNTLAALLNAYCRTNNKFWYVDRAHMPRIVDAPNLSTPDWALSPLVPTPQTADDDFVSRWFVRRVDGVDADSQPNAWAVNTAVDPDAPAIREESEDLESMGYMNSTDGDAAAAAYLNANKSRASFAEGVSVTRGLLTTTGGTPPELWAVAAGEVVQQPNWLSASGDLMFGDAQSWVIGGTQWTQGQPLQVTPLGIAPRTHAQITQATGARKARLTFS